MPGLGSDLDPNVLAGATDDELDTIFRNSDTLPLERFINTGAYEIDLAAGTILNDEHWKGYLPRGLELRNIMARLATGYAKRFWMDGARPLGETIYLQGRILVGHSLETLELDRPTNDLEPGRYVLLRYTDPVFEHVFYDVMRAISDGVIVYRGYAGRFPKGRRGFTGLLIRRYPYALMGVRDHDALYPKAAPVARGTMEGAWRLSAIDTANHAVEVGRLRFEAAPGGGLKARYLPHEEDDSLLARPIVSEHFGREDAGELIGELRRVDERLVIGRWTTEIRGPFAKLLLGGDRGLFHAADSDGGRTFVMRYLLQSDQPA